MPKKSTPKPHPTTAERDWLKENNQSSCDMEELAGRADSVPGLLGATASAFLAAKAAFEEALERIGYEHG